jgi:hypothetical protein
VSSKRILNLEETLRQRDLNIEELEGALRRANESAQDSKKKMI